MTARPVGRSKADSRSAGKIKALGSAWVWMNGVRAWAEMWLYDSLDRDDSLWLNAASMRSKCPDTASFCKIAGHYSGLIVAVDRQFYMQLLLQSELTCPCAAGLFSPNV